MAFLSVYQLMEQQKPMKVDRFPGWTLHLHYDIRTDDVCLTAIRDSDGRRLDYREHLGKEFLPDVTARLADKLGGDFLDLVPMNPENC